MTLITHRDIDNNSRNDATSESSIFSRIDRDAIRDPAESIRNIFVSENIDRNETKRNEHIGSRDGIGPF